MEYIKEIIWIISLPLCVYIAYTLIKVSLKKLGDKLN